MYVLSCKQVYIIEVYIELLLIIMYTVSCFIITVTMIEIILFNNVVMALNMCVCIKEWLE